MHRLIRLPLILVAAAGTARVAEAQLTKPTQPALTVYAAPSSLQAMSTKKAEVTLAWPAVKDATGYRVTRLENVAGATEILIAELPSSAYVFEGSSCVAGSSLPNCAYVDVTRRRNDPRGVPHQVTSGALYTYRVWSTFPGPVVSPPSPSATVQVK